MIVKTDPHGIIEAIHDFFRKAGSRYINKLYIVRNGHLWKLHLPIPNEYTYTTIAGEGTPEQFKNLVMKEIGFRNYPVKSIYYDLKRSESVDVSELNIYTEDPDDYYSRPKDLYQRYVPGS